MTQKTKRDEFFEQAMAQLKEVAADPETKILYLISIRDGDTPETSGVNFFHNAGEAENALVYLNNLTVSMLMHEREQEAKQSLN
jgi:hypothetical protein